MDDLNREESSTINKNIIKVLHIDDEEDFLIITKEFVERLSEGEISVVSSSNPLEALERVETKKFDVIVCDYMMEELNGLDLLRKLKTQDYDIPFIIFTGRGREEVVIKALNLGADYYLRKGLDAKSQYAELVHQIKTVFRHKTAERGLRESEEKFSLFLNNVPAVAYLKDEEGRYTFFNDYLYDVYKVTPEEIIGKTASEFFGEEEGKEIEKEDEIVLREDFWTSIGTRTLGDEEYTFKMYKFPLKREGKPTIIAGFSEDVTQQREMERILHETVSRYRNLVESFNDIVFITDLESRMLYANPALRNQTGFTKDDFQFTQAENPFIHPEDAERVAKFILDFIQSEQEQSDIIENRFIDKEGKTYWFSSVITKITYEGIPALQYIVHNITERKELEEELKDERDLSNLYLDEAGVMFVIVDENEETLQINKKMTEVLGYTEEDLIGKNWFETVYPRELQDEFKFSFQQVIAGVSEPIEYIEIDMQTKDGEKKYVSWRNIAIKDKTGKIIQLLGTGEDITERKDMEKALQEQEERYRTVVELSPDSIVLADLKGNIVFANNSAAIMHGVENPEELIGSSMIEFTAPEDHQRLVNNLRRNFADAQFDQTMEYTMLKKDGTHFPVELRASMIFDDQGKPFGLLGVGRDISERKKFERELKLSEALYRTIFESIGSANAIARDDKIVTLVNAKMEELSGYSKEEIEGKMSWTEFIPETDLERMREISNKRLEDPSSAPSSYESKFITKSGEIRNSLLHVGVIPGTKNVVVSVMDIKELKEVEQKLKKSENLYRTIFETTGTANAIVKEDTSITQVNSRLEELIGYSKEELLRKKWIELVPQSELPKLREFQELRAKDPSIAPSKYETIMITKGGETKDILVYIDKIPGTDESIASVMDISDLKRIQEELERSENLYRMLFTSTGAANITFDEEANITMINSRMEKLSGYTREEVEGKMKWTEFIPEPELSMMLEYNEIRKKDPRLAPIQYESRFIDKEGNIKNILLNVNQLPNLDIFVASLMDITSKKKVEEELKKQREELSDFAHLMAHDIRNSLSAIEGFIDLHIETKEDEYIGKVNKQTLYLRGLLDRSIELAEAGQSVEKSDNVDLNELVKSVAEMILPKGIRITQKDLTTIRADKSKLSQILKNLFENAVIHGKPKSVAVKQLETEGEIILIIKNDGAKISPKVVKDAFETSFSTKEMLEWHGLTIVKKLVTAHGWDIRLDEYDEMTCFEIIIPKKVRY